jgi:uncharacterized phage protein gp47/JayE
VAFTGRSRDTIRAAILSNWSALYASRQETLLVSPGSDAYLWASALAVQLEGLEAQAEQVMRDILPDQASTDALDRHAFVDGLERIAGFTARHTVTVSSAVAGTYSITAGTRMAYSDGTLYTVESASVTTVGASPVGTITVRASQAGASGTRTTGDVLTFTTAPAGLDPTGAVASTVRDGTDAETDEALAARIISRRRDRPGSGNRADWRDWVKGYTGTEITEAYVYPLLAPPSLFPGAGTAGTPGTLTVVAVGPAQGDSYTNTRIVPTDDSSARSTPGSELTRIEDYIEGDRLPDGTDVSATPNDALRPVVLPVGNYAVQQINTTSQDVVLNVSVTDTNAAQWSGSMTVVTSTGSSLTVSGDQTAKDGLRALVELAAGAARRGAFKVFTLGVGFFDGVNTAFPIADADIAYATGTVYPAVANFDSIRTAVFAYFDALGPGDTSPASRWPDENSGGRSTLYRTALAASAIGVSGVLSATTTTPASDVTPAAKHVVTLGTFRVTS